MSTESKPTSVLCALHGRAFTHGCPGCVVAEAERKRRIERLIELSLDPNSLDWEMLERIDEVAWGEST